MTEKQQIIEFIEQLDIGTIAIDINGNYELFNIFGVLSQYNIMTFTFLYPNFNSDDNFISINKYTQRNITISYTTTWFNKSTIIKYDDIKNILRLKKLNKLKYENIV